MEVNPKLGITPEECLEEYKSIVGVVTSKFAHRGRYGHIGIEDIKSVATMGLLSAYSRFDPEQTENMPNFGAYAYRVCMGRVLNFFRDNSNAVKFPRKVREMYIYLNKNCEVQDHTPEQLLEIGRGQDKECTMDLIVDALIYGESSFAASLDQPMSDSSGDTYSSMLVDTSREDPDRRLIMEEFYKTLTEEELTQLSMHLKGMSQRTIAEHYGVTQMTISRKYSLILDKAYKYGGVQRTEEYTVGRRKKEDVMETLQHSKYEYDCLSVKALTYKGKGDTKTCLSLLYETGQSCYEIHKKTNVTYSKVTEWAKRIRGGLRKTGINTKQLVDSRHPHLADKPESGTSGEVSTRSMTPEEVERYGGQIDNTPPHMPHKDREDSLPTSLVFEKSGVTNIQEYLSGVWETMDRIGMKKADLTITITKT